MLRSVICAGVLVAIFAFQSSAANARSMKECSAKYKAAKEADTLHGMKWNDFRKAQCGAEATASPEPAPTAAPPPSPKAGKPAAPVSAPVATGNAVFPSAVSSKYSGESAGKARRETCLDQYRANKATNANGGLKWIEKVADITASATNASKGKAKTLINGTRLSLPQLFRVQLEPVWRSRKTPRHLPIRR